MAPAAAGLAAALVLSGSVVGVAAPADRAEAEGLFLSGGGGLVNLDDIVALAGPYNAYTPGGAQSAALDANALGLIDLGLGVQLFGGNDVLTLGAVGQYARTDASGAFASSGLIGADGAIQAGTGAPGENTTLDLTPVLTSVGAQSLISSLSVELGAVAAQAQAARGATVTPTGDYQIASGQVVLQSPALAALLNGIDADLTAANGRVNALAADGGPIDTTVDGLLGGIDAILEDALLGLADLEDPEVTTAIALDLGTALDTTAATPFSSGAVTVILSTGTVVIDLDELYTLNDLGEDTLLLSPATVNTQISTALDSILNDQLDAALDTALDAVLNGTDVDIDVTSGVLVNGGPAGDLALGIDTTVGALLGLPGSDAPDVSLAGTEILGVDLADIEGPITDYVVASVLPAVGALVDPALDLDTVRDDIDTLLTGTVTTLAPLLDVLDDVVQIVVNVTETPGAFRAPAGLDAGSFTQRAAQIRIAPNLAGGAVTLNLASATVRAVPLAAPANLGLTPNRGPVTGGTSVTFTGTNLADVTGVSFGTEPAAFTVNPDGTITATTPPQAQPGPVTVTLAHPDGPDSSLTFTYHPVVRAVSLSPGQGPDDGGTVVTIVGEGLTGTTGVVFDGVLGTGLTVVDDTRILVTTPAHVPGTVPVVVQHPDGNVAAPSFTYVAGTEIDAVTPPGGPEEGGNVVTITGACFTGATAVLFGTTPATSFTVVSDTRITAVVPAGTGTANVTVVGTPACGTDTVATAYVYTDDPVIGTISPSTGPITGGTVVTITGSNLGAVTRVTFDGVPGTDLRILSDSELTVVAPPGTAGRATVVISGPTGDSSPGVFTYTAVAGGGLAVTGAGGVLAAGLIGLLLLASGIALRVVRRRTA